MRRFFKDFFIYGFASTLGKLAVIFLMPVYTSVLSKEEYGAMALIASCKGIVDLLSNLNIHSGIARSYYEDGVDKKRLVSTGLFSILAISCTVMLAIIATRHFWVEKVLELKEIYLAAFTVMVLSIPCGSLQSYFSILTRFKKKPVLYSVGTIIALFIQIVISVIAVVKLGLGVVGIFTGLLLSELFAVLFFCIINKDYIGFTFDKSYLKNALLFCIPTLPAILAGWVDSSLGQVLIGRYVSMADLAVYSVALTIASAFTLISTPLQNVWYPFLYENYTKPTFHHDIRRLYMVIAIILIMVTSALSLLSKEIVLMLTNNGYVDAAQYIPLLCIPMSIYLMFSFASSGVSISKDTKYIGLSYIAGSCCNLIMLFLTIKYLGIIAVPICLACSRIITYTVLYKVSEIKINYRLPNYLLTVHSAIAVLLYFVVLLDVSLWLRILILSSLFLYSICYLKSRIQLDLKVIFSSVFGR